MKEKVVRFGISMNPELLHRLDEFVKEMNYANRSEALRAILKKELVKKEWEEEEKETVGVLTVVYDHHHKELIYHLLDEQHHFHPLIISSLHIHLDEDNCVEAIMMRGRVKDIKEASRHLSSIKGIKYSNLALATTGKEIP